MDFLVPKYRRDPNEKVHSLYYGVGHGNRTITRMVRKSRTEDRLEAHRTAGPGMERGAGGRIGVLILGGMETSLDEIEYILEAHKQKAFTPRRTQPQIADMCRLLLERRNSLVRHLRRNPSEAPKRKRTARLYLPVGCRLVETSEPGLKVLAQV